MVRLIAASQAWAPPVLQLSGSHLRRRPRPAAGQLPSAHGRPAVPKQQGKPRRRWAASYQASDNSEDDPSAPAKLNDRGPASGDQGSSGGATPAAALPILPRAEPHDQSTPASPPHWWALQVRAGAVSPLLLFLGLLGVVWTADAFIWRVVRMPLARNFLLAPFLVSAAASALAGFLLLPTLKNLKMHQAIRAEGPAAHQVKAGTPTMGGLSFVPVGVAVCLAFFCGGSPEVWACAGATLGFGAIGLLDDGLKVVLSHNAGLPGKLKLLLQLALGWVTTQYKLTRPLFAFVSKSMAQLPWGAALVSGFYSAAPRGKEAVRGGIAAHPHLPGLLDTIGVVHLPWSLGTSVFKLRLGPFLHPVMATLCFAATSNALNLTDGLDGLAAGAAAAAYTGMAIAILPISPDLTRFALCMAGACCGFLVHNSHKARVFMGDTGSLALGGGLAALAVATGMYLPLIVTAALFIAETLSVIAQVGWFKLTKRLHGQGQRLFKMAPLHHHLELCGMRETDVVALAYVAAFVLAIAGAWLGLESI